MQSILNCFIVIGSGMLGAGLSLLFKKGKMEHTFETRFGINDEVYFLGGNKIKMGRISAVICRIVGERVNPQSKEYFPSPSLNQVLYYVPNVVGDPEIYKETELFSTKEDLIASLT